MIKVKVDKNGKNIDSVVISGHALYDDYGKDIVCASASSIAITSINAILRLYSDSISYKKDEALIEIKILKHNDTIDTILINMIELLKELEKDYKKNIKIYE